MNFLHATRAHALTRPLLGHNNTIRQLSREKEKSELA
jgi:hypothetical protein